MQRLLPWTVVALVLGSAWFERDRIWKGFAAAVMLALALYQFAAPVVHPWYITPIVALCVLGPYRFPVVWTLLLPLTYLAYSSPTGGVVERPWVLWLEYGLLFAFLGYEAVFVRRRKTLEEWMHTIPLLRKWLQATIPARMKIKLHRIQPLLPTEARILDLGTGNGGLCKSLREMGHDVQPCDVKDISFFPEVQPLIYNGQRLPFENGAFDTTLLITVLHHTPQPDAVLDEAIRVSSRRIVVMEDIYKNPVQKYLTWFTDSLVNMEFVGHPHTNRSDRRWQKTFASKGLQVVSKNEFRTLLFFRQVIYVLERV
jgi:SAM-dependent methyltransferase